MSDIDGPAEKPLSVWQRFFGAITNPRVVFADVVEHGGWGAAAIILGAVNLILALILLPKMRAAMLWSFAHSPKPLPETFQHITLAVSTITIPAGAVLGMLFYWLVIAFVVWLISLFTGERVKFGTLYAVAAFAWVPAMIGSILRTILILMRPLSALTSTTVSLGAFFPATSTGVLYRIASQISPFTLWSVVLVALGGALAMKTGFGKTLTILLVCWLVVIVVLSVAFPHPKGLGA